MNAVVLRQIDLVEDELEQAVVLLKIEKELRFGRYLRGINLEGPYQIREVVGEILFPSLAGILSTGLEQDLDR